MLKIFSKIRERIYRFFNPTIEDAIRQHTIYEDLRSTPEELARLKKIIEEYEKQISSE